MRQVLLSLLAATCLTAAAPSLAAAQSINERQAALDSRIDAGVQNRSLTASEAAQLRAEFAEIARIEARYRASGRGLTNAERADLDNRFDLLSRRIAYDRNDRDGRDRDRDRGDMNINQHQREIDAKIDAGVRSGALTTREAAELRAEFQSIVRLEAQHRSSGRGLTPAERADLDQRLDRLSRRVSYERNDRDRDRDGDRDRGDMNINQHQREIDAKIDAGVRSGALTTREAAELRAEFQSIVRLEAQHRSSGRGLTPAERADLDQRLDRLSRRVSYERNDRDRDRYGDRGRGDMNINQHQRELDARIDAGVRAGGLSPREAARLRAEFQAIAQQEAKYRASGRGLTQAERADLDQRLDRLERRISRNRADDERRWTHLDQRQADFDRQLDEAVRNRRVTSREAANLRAEFRSIARLEKQYRDSRPGITPEERADLSRRFDRMEANFRASTTPTDNLFDLLLGLAR